MAAHVPASLPLAIRQCAAASLAWAILAMVGCDVLTDEKKQATDATSIDKRADHCLPGRIHVAARRTVQDAGTCDEVVSLDPNTGVWRTEPVPSCSASCCVAGAMQHTGGQALPPR